MKEVVSFNGELLAAGNANVAAVSSAALYGKGIFTTIAVHNGKPFLWEKHWRRLAGNASAMRIDISDYSESAVLTELGRIIAANGVNSGRARITFFDESAGGMWQLETRRRTSMLITAAPDHTKAGPLRISLSGYTINSKSPLAGIKSCNYLENLLVLNAAREAGFDEAIRLNERGQITSACMANLFWLKDGMLYTPPLASGCLEGTTREFIMEHLDCVEAEAGIDAIENADAVFLTSAGLGVAEVAELGDRTFDPSSHSILTILQPAE